MSDDQVCFLLVIIEQRSYLLVSFVTDGKPGFNPDLMLLDLDKLRSSAKYKTYFDERKVNALVKNYIYHSSGEIPSLGDMVNLIAADSESLVQKKSQKFLFHF
jgi:hypothetical protein